MSARTGMIRAAGDRLFRLAKRWLPDEASLQLQHLKMHGRRLNLRDPQTFSELVQARKLYEHDERFALYADKVRAKPLVASELGPEWVIPTLWSGTRLPPIAERTWPLPYVIKANHGCGWNLFVRVEEDRNWEEIERVTASWMSGPYKPYLREHFYKQIPPMLLVEPLIGDPNGLPIDYKFLCFGGRAEYVMVQSNRQTAMEIETIDRDWRSVPLRYSYARPGVKPDRPASYERMLEAAERLAKPFDFVRIDLYEEGGRPLFGEFSFTPGSGFERFEPPEYNRRFGELWTQARARRRTGEGEAEPPERTEVADGPNL